MDLLQNMPSDRSFVSTARGATTGGAPQNPFYIGVSKLKKILPALWLKSQKYSA